GAVKRETYIRTSPQRTEVWRGKMESNGFSGTREMRFTCYDPVLNKITVVVTNETLASSIPTSRGITISQRTGTPWGYEETLRVEGGTDEYVPFTFTEYHRATDSNGLPAIVKMTHSSDGHWTRHTMNRWNRTSILAEPFGNSTNGAPLAECRVTRFYYAGDPALAALGFDPMDRPVPHDARPRLTTTRALGREVSRTWHAYLPNKTVEKVCLEPDARYDTGNALVTTTYYRQNGDFAGRPDYVVHPDGTITLYYYTLNPADNSLTVDVRTGAAHDVFVTNGTRNVTVQNAAGRVVLTKTQDIESGLVLSEQRNSLDRQGRVVFTTNTVTGAAEERTYGCCGPEKVVGADGVTTEYEYNALGQVTTGRRLGLTTLRSYDIFGNVMHLIAHGPYGGMSEERQTADPSGRPSVRVDPLGYPTLFSYSKNAAGGECVVTTHPDGSTAVRTTARDGSLVSLSGTAVPPVCYARGVWDGGEYVTEYRGADTSVSEWVREETDMAGRTVRTVFADGHTEETLHDNLGRASARTGGPAAILYEYGPASVLRRTVTDMNGNLQVDTAGPDRIVEGETEYRTVNGVPMRVTRSYDFPDEGSDERRTVAESFAALDGRSAMNVSFGRTNRTEVVINRARASRTETMTAADGVKTVRCHTNGMLVAETVLAADGSRVTSAGFFYDAFGRVVASRAPGPSGSEVVTSFSYDAAGRVTNETVEAGGETRVTSRHYDSMGRLIRLVLPGGMEQRFRYDLRGLLVSREGDGIYPASYSYTTQGRMASLATYRNGSNGIPDVTTWGYDAKRGWPASKTYADG
ncbi:MAG: RHS repeat protein, partial [Lentisphaerae bacterium]|nr:RHS repeat protein [Lentisphaerota bacterium]